MSPSAMFPSVVMQQYKNIQGLSPFSNQSHFNHSLLSAAQLQAAHLTNVALQQAATNANIKKTETSTKTQNHDKDDKSEPTKNLAHSIDRLLKKDEAKREEAKPDSDDHISSTSDSTESQTKSKLLLNAEKDVDFAYWYQWYLFCKLKKLDLVWSNIFVVCDPKSKLSNEITLYH